MNCGTPKDLDTELPRASRVHPRVTTQYLVA